MEMGKWGGWVDEDEGSSVERHFGGGKGERSERMRNR